MHALKQYKSFLKGIVCPPQNMKNFNPEGIIKKSENERKLEICSFNEDKAQASSQLV
jgi:hypothetical protein